MATKKFIIEVEEGYTHCDDCPINCDGICARGEIEKFGLDCDILNFFTMRIKEYNVPDCYDMQCKARIPEFKTELEDKIELEEEKCC